MLVISHRSENIHLKENPENFATANLIEHREKNTS